MEVKDLTYEKLIQPDTTNQLIKDMDQVINWQDAKECFKFIKLLTGLGRGHVLPKIYSDKLEELQWIAFSHISESEVIELFENGFDVGLELIERLEFDILTKFKAYIDPMVYEDQERFKQKVSKALESSPQKITSKKIEVNSESKQPTVSNWLKDYIVEVVNRGSEDVVLAKAEYLNASKNIKALDAKDNERIKFLIDFYDFCNTSALLPGGYAEDYIIEWPDGATQLLSDGRLHDITAGAIKKQVEKKIDEESKFLIDIPDSAEEITEKPQEQVKATSLEEQEMIAAYKGDIKQVNAISKEGRKILKKFGSDTARLRAEFFLAVQKKNNTRVIALLRILAQKKDLEDFIKEDPKLNKFLIKIWQKQYGDDFVADFDKKSDQLKFTRLFLRYILEQRLGMETSDAARVGLQIGNIFVSLGKKSYNKMAYFDVKTKTFNWLD